MKDDFVLTMEFISSDVEAGEAPLPIAESHFWDELLARLRLSPGQVQESAASYQMAWRCKVGARGAALGRGRRAAWAGRRDDAQGWRGIDSIGREGTATDRAGFKRP
jgi:hypothetical protein